MTANPIVEIGSILFEDIDQIDLTGPFEVLSRLPNARHRFFGLKLEPVRDVMGMVLTPDAIIEEAPRLDILHVPGGSGQERLMQDERVLAWLRYQAEGARSVFSVCTGALLLGAAGLLKDRRATTHWASHHLLPLFGATAVNERVVIDGKYLFAAGVTAGIDGALQLAANLHGVEVAQRIQLDIAYAPEPPFNSGTPTTAPAAVLAASKDAGSELRMRREATAEQFARQHGFQVGRPT
jgi:cyclohexyl-isocyanide hydratase